MFAPLWQDGELECKPEEDAYYRSYLRTSTEDYRCFGKISEVGFRVACSRPTLLKATPTAAAHTLPQPWPRSMFPTIIRSVFSFFTICGFAAAAANPGMTADMALQIC